MIQLLDSLNVLLPQERAEAANELGAAFRAIFEKRKAPVPPFVTMLEEMRPEDLNGEGPDEPPKRRKGRKKPPDED